MSSIRSAVTLILYLGVVLTVCSCATQSISKDRLTQSAFITSGDTNIWTAVSFSGVVSVVDVDGVVPEHSQGPIELTPGPHKVSLKYQGRVVVREINAAAGDVYEFAVMMGGSSPGGDLVKVKSAGNGR
jgi:hypothetical protein